MDTLNINYTDYKTELLDKFKNKKKVEVADPGIVKAFIPGIILSVKVRQGQQIKANTPLLVLDAMKMHNIVYSEISGTVQEVLIKDNEKVIKDQVLVRIKKS